MSNIYVYINRLQIRYNWFGILKSKAVQQGSSQLCMSFVI